MSIFLESVLPGVVLSLMILCILKFGIKPCWDQLKRLVHIIAYGVEGRKHDCYIQHQIAISEINFYDKIVSESVTDHLAVCDKYHITGKKGNFKVVLHNQLNAVVNPPKDLREVQRDLPKPRLPDPSRTTRQGQRATTSSTSGSRHSEQMSSSGPRGDRCRHPSWMLLSITLCEDRILVCESCGIFSRVTYQSGDQIETEPGSISHHRD